MLLTDKTVEVETGKDGHDESSMWVMEANLDDCTGEALGYAMEVLLEAGARDVWYTPAYMKKKPSGVCASCTDNGRKTGRIRTACLLLYDHDRCAPLSSREDDTATGSKGDPDPLRGSKGKICKRGGVDTCYPEYESVRAICRETGKRFMEVFHGVMEDGSISLQ